jgi:hypothetical protein
MEQDLLHGRIVPFLHSIDLFWGEFKGRYGVVNRDENNRVNLKNLKQKGSVQEYLSLFETYSATLNYNDQALRDMFYDGLSEEIINDIISQDFDPAGNTTLHQLAERALKIDKRRRPSKKASTPSTTSSARNNNVSFASNTSNATREQLKKGDKVYMIGTDGRAKKGIIADIGKNLRGKSVPNVKWNGESSNVQVPFQNLRLDTRPTLATPLARGSGPGPMELDANKGKATLSCHVCGGKGHFTRECPSRNVSGHEARIEEVESDSSDEESLKDDA